MFEVVAARDGYSGTWTFKGDINYHVDSLRANGYSIVSVVEK